MNEAEETIFNAASHLSDPEQRALYLKWACGNDAALRERIERLLEAGQRADAFFAQDPVGVHALACPSNASESPGTTIGRYKLLQKIGEGGCGVVYMAEQEEPIRRRVALKVIKLGMDTKQVIGRFEVERQALAMMDHPNIAKVLDAGATDAGRPYFVMELVRGIKITDYCDQNSLSTRDRLELFMKVAHAVQHAHQKGIIHRDIKPSNILVTLHDGVPVPKVIDFGIAKATEQKLTDKTLFTAFEQFIGTPAYVSPEQAEMSGLDIDTRTDIYSLGVLLYELLIGKTPFETQELLQSGLDEMRRIIREKEPVRPSTRLSTMIAGELTTTAQRRRASPPELIHVVRGDLDWIVMKCLEKDRTRRYETANGLSMDIQRHLQNEPVLARPPSKLYQFQKLVRRNKLAFGAVAGLAAVLVMGVMVSGWQATRATLAEREQRRLRQQAQRAQAQETELRHRAEQQHQRAEEAVTRLEIERAEQLFATDSSSRALAYLARLLRQQPTNRVVAERIVSALTYRNFCLPQISPLTHDSFPQGWRQYGYGNAREVPYSFVHDGAITSAEFSPDGTKILTASKDYTARLWDSRTGLPLLVPIRHEGAILSARFSPNGQQLVTASMDKTARIWDVATGQAVTGPLRHEGRVLYAEFSPDGERVLTACENTGAYVWDARTGHLQTGPLRHAKGVRLARFSPDGELVATADPDWTVRTWDAHTGQARTRPLERRTYIRTLEFSSDSRKVMAAGAWGGRPALHVWDTLSGKELLAGEEDVQDAHFSPDGKLLAAISANYDVRFWDTLNFELLAHSITHERTVFSIEFSADGKRLVTASRDHTARVWDVQSGRPLTEPLRHDTRVVLARFSPDGQRALTVPEGNSVLVWDLRRERSLTLELSHASALSMDIARFSPDGQRVVTGCRDRTARVWDARTGQTLTAPLVHGTGHLCWRAEFSPDGSKIIIADAGHPLFGSAAELWDAKTGSRLKVFQHPAKILAARFRPNDGKWLITASDDQTAAVWDVETGNRLVVLKHHDGVYDARFSPDGKLVLTASKDRTAQVWNPATGQQVGAPLQHSDAVNTVDVSCDSQRVLTASKDKTARVWDARTGQPLTPPLGHDDEVKRAAFSADGQKLVTVAGGVARVWDSRTGSPLTDSLKHRGSVQSAQFSSDGRRVASCAGEELRIWDAESGHALAEPLRHPDKIFYAEFSPDGCWVLTASDKGTAGIWELPPATPSIPNWLPELAEAVGGQRINAQNEFETVPPQELLRLKERLAELPANDDYRRWGKWFFADSSTRCISPSSPVTTAECLRMRAKQHSLREAARHQVRGERLLIKKEWAQAIAEYSESIQINPEDSVAYLARAQAHVQLGDFQKAEADIQKALALQPDDARMLNEAAWYYVIGPNSFRSPQKALPLALKAVELSNGGWNELNTLGVAYYRLNEWDKAAETLENAAKASHVGGTAFDFFFLAMSYHRLGDAPKAADYYAKAIKWLEDKSSGIPTTWKEELEDFRAEADVLLGHREVRDLK